MGSGNEYGRVIGNIIAQGPENFSISQEGTADRDAIVTFADGALLDVANGGNAGAGEGHAVVDGADTYNLTDHSFTNPTLLTVYQDTNEGNGAVIVITGTGTDDSAITETFTLGNAQQTLTGTKLFKTVTSMTYSDGNAGADAGAVEIGTAPNGQWATGASALSALGNINLQTQQGSNDAILVIDGAIEKVSSMRAYLGAIENRLEHTVSNLMNVAENTSDSRSRIYDADFSVESANLAKAQVLQQVGAAMLTQANARPQLVLQLLQ